MSKIVDLDVIKSVLYLVQIAVGSSVTVLVWRYIFKEKASLCDRCEHLYHKWPKNSIYYRYTCDVSNERVFDHPPEYCRFFKKKDGENK